MQEVEERLKQEIQPLAADLSLPPGLELKMKGAQKGVGYGGSREIQGYTKVGPNCPWAVECESHCSWLLPVWCSSDASHIMDCADSAISFEAISYFSNGSFDCTEAQQQAQPTGQASRSIFIKTRR